MDFLQIRGHNPLKIKYGSAWFLSPMRQETTPSFKVNIDKNVWFDFGTGEGGDLITFVMKLNNVKYREALEIIGNDSYQSFPNLPENKNVAASDESGRIKINRLQALSNPALISQYPKPACLSYFCQDLS